jgi:hypothetical protein
MICNRGRVGSRGRIIARVRPLATIWVGGTVRVLGWMDFILRWRGIAARRVVVVRVVAVRCVHVVALAIIRSALVIIISVVVAEASAEPGAVFVAVIDLSLGEVIYSPRLVGHCRA